MKTNPNNNDANAFLRLQPFTQPETAIVPQSQSNAPLTTSSFPTAPTTGSAAPASSPFTPKPASSSPSGQIPPPSFTSAFSSNFNFQGASQTQGGQPAFRGGFGAPSAGPAFGAPDSSKEPELKQSQSKSPFGQSPFGVPANNFTFTAAKADETKQSSPSQPTATGGFSQGKLDIRIVK